MLAPFRNYRKVITVSCLSAALLLSGGGEAAVAAATRGHNPRPSNPAAFCGSKVNVETARKELYEQMSAAKHSLVQIRCD